VPDGDSDLLRYLSSLSLVPGCDVELRYAAPFGGPVTVAGDTGEHAISRELATLIGVG
jgi:Fe2+ transport system protein FeoA